MRRRRLWIGGLEGHGGFGAVVACGLSCAGGERDCTWVAEARTGWSCVKGGRGRLLCEVALMAFPWRLCGRELLGMEGVEGGELAGRWRGKAGRGWFGVASSGDWGRSVTTSSFQGGIFLRFEDSVTLVCSFYLYILFFYP